MIDARVEDLLGEVGLKASSGTHATIVGRDPVLGCPFPVGEAAAVALAACGVAVSDLWVLRGGRPQRARVDVRRAAASLHSREYLRVNGGPAPLGPAAGNPLVDFYRCGDGRWVHLHGGPPHLATARCGSSAAPRERDRRGRGRAVERRGARERARRGPSAARWYGATKSGRCTHRAGRSAKHRGSRSSRSGGAARAVARIRGRSPGCACST